MPRHADNKGRDKWRSVRGASQIEFVLTIFIVIFVVWGVIEICMAVYAMSVIADAAREGTRYAIVHGSGNSNCSGTPSPASKTTCSDKSAANVINVVKDYARFSIHDTGAIVVTVTYPDTYNDPGNRVQVDVSYNYVPWIQIPGMNPTLKASSQAYVRN